MDIHVSESLRDSALADFRGTMVSLFDMCQIFKTSSLELASNQCKGAPLRSGRHLGFLLRKYVCIFKDGMPVNRRDKQRHLALSLTSSKKLLYFKK